DGAVESIVPAFAKTGGGVPELFGLAARSFREQHDPLVVEQVCPAQPASDAVAPHLTYCQIWFLVGFDLNEASIEVDELHGRTWRLVVWCGRGESNPHRPFGPTDFLTSYGFHRARLPRHRRFRRVCGLDYPF